MQMKHKLPEEFSFGYEDGDSIIVWDVRDIWLTAMKLPIEHLPIQSFTLLIKEVRKSYNSADIKRINKSDIEYPIIINNQEPLLVIDGFHRLSRHRQLGNKYVPCKRLDVLPPAHYIRGEPFEIPGLNFSWETKWDKQAGNFSKWIKK